MNSPDAVVIGAGILGAACARELAGRGLRVTVIESRTPAAGATGAGMGHVVALDGSEPEFALSRYSQTLWDRLAPELPPQAEHDPCGTLWVAEDEDDMTAARERQRFFEERGVAAEILGAEAMRRAEPCLAADLAGGLRIPGDSVLYQPAVTSWMLLDAARSGRVEVLGAQALGVETGQVHLTSGDILPAGIIVVAAGVRSLELMPAPVAGLGLRPRKGHLLVTERVPGFCRHQLVELGYLKSAHGNDADSVAFNLQPRATDQVILGSSRQYDSEHSAVEPDMVARMIERGTRFVPGLEDLRAVRIWTGFRPASHDGLPYLGPVPHVPGVFLAAGHEGLGITTAPGSARIVADLATGADPDIDPAPYLPGRAA